MSSPVGLGVGITVGVVGLVLVAVYVARNVCCPPRAQRQVQADEAARTSASVAADPSLAGQTVLVAAPSQAVDEDEDETADVEGFVCTVCILPFSDEGAQRPCICPSCGNSCCLSCYRRMTTCPFCKAATNPAADHPVMNIQLMRILRDRKAEAEHRRSII